MSAACSCNTPPFVFFWFMGFMGFMAMARLVTPRLVAGEWHERHVGELLLPFENKRIIQYVKQ